MKLTKLVAVYYCTLNDQLVCRHPEFKLLNFGTGVATGFSYSNIRKTMTFIGYL